MRPSPEMLGSGPPASAAPHPPDRAPWPCRYCQTRDTVVITWRDAVMLVCFCEACEQGWCATVEGRPKD